MAISQATLGRNIQRNLPMIGGAGVGVGAPATLREFVDVQDGQPFSIVGEPGSTLGRLSRPSVAWGLGAGTATGLLWWLTDDMNPLNDFLFAHTVAAIPTGAASAALPKEGSGGGGGGSGQAARSQRVIREPRSGSPSADGEFAASGGTSPGTQPAN